MPHTRLPSGDQNICWKMPLAESKSPELSALDSEDNGSEELDVDEDPAAEARVLGFGRGSRYLPVFEFEGRHVTVSPFDRARLSRWLLEVGAATGTQLSDAAPSRPGS